MYTKRKKNLYICGVAMAAVLMMGGCGTYQMDNAIAKEEDSYATSTDPINVEKEVDTDTLGNISEAGIIGAAESPEEIKNDKQETADIPMVELPDGVEGLKAEATPNQELRDLIIDYMEIPEEYFGTTRYYYNYVDLDDDGTNEIFAVIMGPYTSGTGGNSAVWVSENAGELHVLQDFMLINEPIIISDTKTNGLHELIVPYYGDNTSRYSVINSEDGEYIYVSDGKIIDNLDNVTGKAIIANDILKEIEAGIMGFDLLSE